jgi:hypothetical protein
MFQKKQIRTKYTSNVTSVASNGNCVLDSAPLTSVTLQQSFQLKI